MSFINCEDLTENAKVKGYKPDSESNGNRLDIFLAGDFYKDSLEYLLEELARIGALIQIFLEKNRFEAGNGSQDFPGMFILEAEANSILQAVCCGSEAFRAQELKSEEIEALGMTISRKKAESLKRGIELRLHDQDLEHFQRKKFPAFSLLSGNAS